MSTLVRASDLSKKVVVTYAGEDIAQVKDIVYAAGGGEVGAFTLAGRGFFAGPLKTALPWHQVVGLGADAIIIASPDVLVPLAEALAGPPATAEGAPEPGKPASSRSDILHSEVLTDTGVSLGRVADVIIGISQAQGQGQADVVGYEIEPAESLGRGKQPLLIPLPDTISASGEHLMVPAAAQEFLSDNLAAFGAAVDTFRAQIRGKHS